MNKRKLKDKAQICILCGKYFSNNVEKFIHGLERKNKISSINTIVICAECKSYILKNNLILRDLYFEKRLIVEYFKSFNRSYISLFFKRLNVLREEYKNA